VDSRDKALRRAMPWLFVLIWSTGFIVARFGMPYAPPLTFLVIRYALSVLCFGIWIMVSGAAWPRSREQGWHLMIAGVLIHAGYLGGVWAAVKAGIGAGTIALLVGLQPVLTALWVSTGSRGATSAHRVTGRQWLGLGFGLGGLALVVSGKLGAGEVTAWNLSLALLALLSITVGTLYQKRFVAPCDVRTANTIQLLAALVVTLPLAALESEQVVWNISLIGAMAWSVFGLTLGGSSLLYLLIQRGAATSVTSLMYLVPPVTALLARVIFGEALSVTMMLGMALAATGVALVVRTATR
jgi:drug/metabolite transporter (DMT)-like permease